MTIFINTRFLEFENKPIYQYTLLAIITLLAAALRFYKLGEWSFWMDEMFAAVGVDDGFNNSIIRQSISQMLIRVAIDLLGISEWSARLIPAIVGIISIPALYFPIRKILGPAVGLIAIFLLAVSPWHIYWSQNARFYVALLLFYTLALLTFYYGIEQDRPWYLLASLILLGLATKERLLALFLVPVVVSYIALLIILPFEKPPGLRWRNLIIFALPGMIIGLFFAGPYIINLSGWLTSFGRVNNNPLRILAGVVYEIGLPTVCIAILGAGYLLITKNRAVLLLSLGAIIPLVTVMAMSTFQFTSSRYVFISLTSWIILASLVIIKLFLWPQKSVKLLAVGLSLFLLFDSVGSSLVYFYYENGNRDNIRAAFELIKEQKRDSDLVAVMNHQVGDYYLQDKTVGYRRVDLASVEQRQVRVWYVEDAAAYGAFPEMHMWLEKNAQLVTNMDVDGLMRNFRMRVYLYDPVSKNLSDSTD